MDSHAANYVSFQTIRRILNYLQKSAEIRKATPRFQNLPLFETKNPFQSMFMILLVQEITGIRACLEIPQNRIKHMTHRVSGLVTRLILNLSGNM